MFPKAQRVNTYLPWVLLFLAILGLLLGAMSLHLSLDALAEEHESVRVYMCIPSGKFLKPFTFGYEQLVADYFWIKTISYFGDHLMSDRKYPWLYHLLDLVTTLDPHFIWPYYFGGIVLFWFAFAIVLLSFLLIGPGLITELLTITIDGALVLIAAATRALRRRLGR